MLCGIPLTGPLWVILLDALTATMSPLNKTYVVYAYFITPTKDKSLFILAVAKLVSPGEKPHCDCMLTTGRQLWRHLLSGCVVDAETMLR